MPKYSKRDNSSWTLSSTALGWGSAVAVALLVFVFAFGVYFGYGWGWEQGREVGLSESPDIPDQLAKFRDETTAGFGTPPEEPADEYPDLEEERAYSAEDLGFLDEELEEPGSEPETVEKIEEPEADEETTETPSPVDRSPVPRPAEKESTVSEKIEEPQRTGETQNFFVIQAASSQNRENAERAAEELRQQGHSVSIREATIGDQTWYRIRVGEFASRRAASDYAGEMVKDGQISDYWISQVEK